MTCVTVDEFQRDFARLVAVVESGEVVALTRAGRVVAEIHPVEARSIGPRPFALCAGEFVVPSAFNDPLPEDVLAAFEGATRKPSAEADPT